VSDRVVAVALSHCDGDCGGVGGGMSLHRGSEFWKSRPQIQKTVIVKVKKFVVYCMF